MQDSTEASTEKTLSQIVREGVEKACKDFTSRVKPLGFRRTQKMLWTRPHSTATDYIHFHRGGSTSGAPYSASVTIRVQCGIQPLQGGAQGAGSLGPSSDAASTREGRYHLRFNAETGSTYERCVEDLVRFVVERGEPWFHENSSKLADSPAGPAGGSGS